MNFGQERTGKNKVSGLSLGVLELVSDNVIGVLVNIVNGGKVTKRRW